MNFPFKIKRIIFPVFIAIAACISAIAQDMDSKPVLADEFGTNCYEDFTARLDGFAQYFTRSPTSTGVIFMTGKQDEEGQNLNYLKWLKKYLSINRGIPEDRFVILRHPNSEVRKFEFWNYPQNEVAKISVENFSYNFSGTTLFDRAWADVPNRKNARNFEDEEIFDHPFFELGCGFGPNTWAFADVLLSNESVNGHIFIFNKSRKNTKKVKDFALNELVNRYKVPRNRLKVFYGGKRSDPEVEFWLVPEGSKPLNDLKELK